MSEGQHLAVLESAPAQVPSLDEPAICRTFGRGLGLDDVKSAGIPDLGREVNELTKRIDRFTGHAPEGDGDRKVSWKGMV